MIQSSDGINRILCCSYVVCVCVVWKTWTQIVFSGDFSIAISILRINNQSNEWRSLTAGVHSAHKLTDTWTMPHERRQTRAHDDNDGVNGTMWQLNSVKRLSPSLSFSYVSQVCDWQRAASSLSLFLFQFVLPVFSMGSWRSPINSTTCEQHRFGSLYKYCNRNRYSASSWNLLGYLIHIFVATRDMQCLG